MEAFCPFTVTARQPSDDGKLRPTMSPCVTARFWPANPKLAPKMLINAPEFQGAPNDAALTAAVMVGFAVSPQGGEMRRVVVKMRSPEGLLLPSAAFPAA